MLKNSPIPIPPGLDGLLNSIDQELASIDMSEDIPVGHRYAILGLAAMSRTLRALASRIETGFPDTISADVRLVYENWLISHLLLESSTDEIDIFLKQDRHRRNQILVNEDVDLTYGAMEPPSPEKPYSTYKLAELLQDKLNAIGAEGADLPLAGYERVFRNESYVGGHPSVASLALYMDPSTYRVAIPQPAIDTAIVRLRLATILVGYFANMLFKARHMEAKAFHELSKEAPLADWLSAKNLGPDNV